MWLDQFRRRESLVAPERLEEGYKPRPGRFGLAVPLSFVADNVKQQGCCINVSESGLLATFARPIDIWTEGEISLLIGGYYVDIGARVARTQLPEIGFAFLIHTENDRLAIRIMLDFARTGVMDCPAMPDEARKPT